MSSLTQKLSNTKTAAWYETQFAQGRGKRRDYVRALNIAVNESPSAKPTRDTIVDAVGNRTASTLYSLVGQGAAGFLLNQHDADVRRTQPYTEVVDGLVIETKVWSHWRHREGWLAELDSVAVEDAEFAAGTLIKVLVAWARQNPHLAVMLSHAAPLSAVEDLLVICGGDQHLAGRADALLTKVVNLTLSPTEPSSSAVLDLVRDDLRDLLIRPREPVELAVELADRVTQALSDLEYHLPDLPAERRRTLADEVRPQLAALLALLEEDGSPEEDHA